ncbi:flagellar biosynthetic protein FliR [Palleronia sp. LCG004]|uniref:flagellar biosynthetic protein FliR n=1 Tax=Palleronia sp. LCG004 TaxID=3079304 RepID=UPI00294210EC|nr:flagellar biosynthetic protein FliR [Palleronia sp. LCG004]WOI56184.1 flagellar biosynthetic protein FliR [Palleronia sp. LCG004]
MIQGLTALTELASLNLAAAFAVFLRVGAIMALLPGFGEQSIPVRVRLVIALAFTVITAPAIAPTLPSALLDRIGPAIGAEVVIGLSLGATLRLFVMALSIAGSIAAQSVSLAQILGGAGVDPQPAIGHIMVLSGLTLAIMMGLHIKIAQLIIYSYELMPPGQWPDAADMLTWGVDRVGKAFSLGFTLAAPFVIISMIYNLALGVINRAMPQLMVSFVGAPAITAGGLIVLAMSLPFVLQVWLSLMDQFIVDPTGAPR